MNAARRCFNDGQRRKTLAIIKTTSGGFDSVHKSCVDGLARRTIISLDPSTTDTLESAVKRTDFKNTHTSSIVA